MSTTTDVSNLQKRIARINMDEIDDEEIKHNIRFRDKFGEPFPFEVVEYDPNSGNGIKRLKTGETQAFFHKDGFVDIDQTVDPTPEQFAAAKELIKFAKKIEGAERQKILLDMSNKITDRDFNNGKKLKELNIKITEVIAERDLMKAAIEQANLERAILRKENQILRDENTKLKGNIPNVNPSK